MQLLLLVLRKLNCRLDQFKDHDTHVRLEGKPVNSLSGHRVHVSLFLHIGFDLVLKRVSRVNFTAEALVAAFRKSGVARALTS